MDIVLRIAGICCYLGIWLIFATMGYDLTHWQPWAIYGLFAIAEFFYLSRKGYFNKP